METDNRRKMFALCVLSPTRSDSVSVSEYYFLAARVVRVRRRGGVFRFSARQDCVAWAYSNRGSWLVNWGWRVTIGCGCVFRLFYLLLKRRIETDLVGDVRTMVSSPRRSVSVPRPRNIS